MGSLVEWHFYFLPRSISEFYSRIMIWIISIHRIDSFSFHRRIVLLDFTDFKFFDSSYENKGQIVYSSSQPVRVLTALIVYVIVVEYSIAVTYDNLTRCIAVSLFVAPIIGPKCKYFQLHIFRFLFLLEKIKLFNCLAKPCCLS